MPNKVSLCMVIHSHQPVGNFDHVIEEAYQKSYLPFLETLARHPRIRLSLHSSGVLWQWIEAQHPEFLRLVRDLTDRGQIEHVGGGFYEPILAAIPDAAKITQVRRLSDYLTTRFGLKPRGVWVAERVWEQGLIMPLAEAGAEYTLLDDTHFLAAGEEAASLHQVYLTEESGSPLMLVPSLQMLRYTIPFREPEETLSILREGLRHQRALFAVGDDCEKFGVWPGTYEHCYTQGWLERFFQALENADHWLEVTTVSRYIDAHPPERRVYLPTASYAEMMMWALPAKAAEDLEMCLEEASKLPDGSRMRRFLRGGPWRNFLSKYHESNQLQKLMLRTFRRWNALRQVVAEGSSDAAALDCAGERLMAAQCNDAYWHGIFGGLYAPHLRSALYGKLIQAESILDRLDPGDSGALLTVEDFDIDGHEELLLDCPQLGAIFRPADGGSISSLRSKAAGVELINSLQRRPEAYHRLVRQQSAKEEHTGQAPASIHDRMRSKEANLGDLLRYDCYPRHAFRTYLFPLQKSWQDFDNLRLNECADLAGGIWDVAEASSQPFRIQLRKRLEINTGSSVLNLRAEKTFTLSSEPGGWNLDCALALRSDDAPPTPWALGLEIVLNLLAPNAADRYYRIGASRYPLEFRGEYLAPRFELVDEWQRLQVVLESPSPVRWWTVPIETISQSEAGFERIYQGSAILAVWNVETGAGRETEYPLRMSVRLLTL